MTLARGSERPVVRVRLPHVQLVWFAFGWLLLVIALAVLAPFLPVPDPDQTSLLEVNLAPGSGHPFGTDGLGRDIMSRAIWGARISLLGPLFVAAMAVLTGSLLAVFAAWRGKASDASVGFAVDISMAFPALLLAILAVAILGRGWIAPVLAITLAYVPYVTRLMRGVALRERRKPYIAALTSVGFGGTRVGLFHLLPNIRGFAVALFALSFGYAMVDLAALSFLGLGVQPPTADWGSMVNEGKNELLSGHPQLSVTAGLLIVITVVCVNFIGERLTKDAEGAA
jgi:peptide/nickel transport system permease protein